MIEKANINIGPDSTESLDQCLSKLSKYRTEITYIDRQLANLLVARMRNAIEIGKLKKTMNMETYQKDRWSKVMKNVKNQFSQTKLYDENKQDFDYLIQDVWETIHLTSCNLQNKNQ